MSGPLEKIGQELDNLAAEYEAHFAGKPRNTRNPDNLAKLITRMRELLGRIEALPDSPDNGKPNGQKDPEKDRLLDAVQGNLRVYEAERVAIVEAKAAGPEFEEMAELSSHANFIFARYARHFAGQSRTTRDMGLLAELIEELELVEVRMAEVVERSPIALLKNDLALVQRTLEMYRVEEGQIERVQSPSEPEVHANVLANLANGQMRIYRVHFAGRSRMSRRPGLLQRVIAGLSRIHRSMTGLSRAGLNAEFNQKNIAVVEGSLRMYQGELGEIRKVRQEASLEQLMAALSQEANLLFEEYGKGFAGKDRKGVDLQALSDLCDRLGEVRRQMRDLSRAKVDEDNDRNLQVVGQQLGLFEQEYERVRQAQQPPAS
jgi:hypothetical protein